ncbi:MAG: hypothetical protein RR192_03225, partial [Peptostreptococcaceae bacterium]
SNETSKLNKYEVEVNNIVKARQVIEKIKEDESITLEIQEDRLLISCSREDIAQVNSSLVKSDILVYSITPVNNTLEDEFMKITTGSKSQIS